MDSPDTDTPLADVKVAPPIVIPAPRQDSESDDDEVVVIAELPIAPNAFLDAMKDVCPYIKDQLENVNATLYGQSFKDYAKSAIEKFQALYPSCKYDRLALQVLIVFHLSSQERVQCRDKKDAQGASTSAAAKYMKRWQTRTIAKKHLPKHLDKIEDEFGDTVKGLVGKKTWLDALGLDEIELYLKECYHPTLMAKRLLEIADNPAAARETLEIALIIYHVLTATRTKVQVGSHWSNGALVSSFKPVEALGYLSPARYESLYSADGDGSAFSAKAKALINKLWTVLNDNRAGNQLPDHPRYRDLNVPVALSTVEKNYLQYLPTFDTTYVNREQRTQCESVVRKRVVASVKAYRDAWGKDNYPKTTTISFTENRQPGTKGRSKSIRIKAFEVQEKEIKFTATGKTGNVPTDITDTEDQKIRDFVTRLIDYFYLDMVNGAVNVTITFETGNKRRDTRRDNVKERIKTLFEEKETLNADQFVDLMLQSMKNDFYVDQAFDDGVARLIFERDDFVPKAWFPLKLQDIQYSQLFPNCGFGVGDKLASIDEHYTATGGSSPRPAHYMDWRNHKDLWLYDCFPIPATSRPLFCSLSMQPIVPQPNTNYGHHVLLFNRNTTKNRCIYTLGDKQQPRRSMLLLLDDLLYSRKKKDGDAGQSAKTRQKVADDLFRRMEMVRVHGAKTITEQWASTLLGPKIRYPSPDLLFECQIFGQIDVGNDFVGVITFVDEKSVTDLYPLDTFYKTTAQIVAAQTHLDTRYSGTLLPYRHVNRQKGASGDEASAEREEILNKEAEDHVDVD